MPPPPGMMASVVSGRPMTAAVEAIRMSHASASSKPPPSATPLIAAIVGTGISATACIAREIEATASATSTDPRPARSFRSAPALNARSPSPTKIVARASGSSRTAFEASAISSTSSRLSAFIASGRARVNV